MLLLNEISYRLVPQKDLVTTLRSLPKEDCTFDYEAYNTRDGKLSLEPWDEDTHPFLFSVCTLSNPENTIKVFQIGKLSETEKSALHEFITSRRTWSFNCKYESAITSKLMGRFVFFDDVQCLYKIDGRFINGLSLKTGTSQLMGVPVWSDATWETHDALKAVIEKIQATWVKKRKTTELLAAFLEGDVRRAYRLIEGKLEARIEMSDTEAEFYNLLIKVKPYMTPQLVLDALVNSRFDACKITLKDVAPEIVERYAAYDAYATACCYDKLYSSCKDQYVYYIKQSHLAMLMEAYGMTRDLKRESEIEAHYKEQILQYMKKILRIRQFSDLLKVEYVVREINPASGRMKNMPYSKIGLDIEDSVKIDNAADYECLKENYYNYAATHKDTVKIFYDALFSSEKAQSAVMVYHIKKLLVQVEGFTETVNGQEMHRARNMSYETDEAFLTEIRSYVESRRAAAKAALNAKTGGSKNFYSKADLERLNIAEDDPLYAEFRKWDKMSYNMKITIEEALSLTIAPAGEKTKDEDRNATTEDIRLSLRKENLEILYSALSECAGMKVDVPWEEMEWEMQLVFCCKMLKKLDKALNSYILGRVGRERVRKCAFGGSLLEVPIRTLGGQGNLFQTSFSDCSADTKRWRSPIHAIPRGCELSELIVPRLMDSILVHYDYCWHKDTVLCIRDMATDLRWEHKTIEELYNNPSNYTVCSCDIQSDYYIKPPVVRGTIKDVRKVRKESKLLELTLTNGFKLRLTKEHNLYKKDYVKTKASDLVVGDRLITLKGNKPQPTSSKGKRIVSIEEVAYADWVYTIEIAEDHHNYFVVASDDGSEMILSSNSQSEVRVIAALAQERELLNMFRDNPKADVHRLMASRVWNKDPKLVTPEERRASKGMVFGTLYGMSLESTAAGYFDSNITVARDVRDKFFSTYPKIVPWCEAQHKQIERYKYVNTIFGDKIWIEAKSRGELHRRSQNYPVQSSSSSIAGYGIWNVWEHCRNEKIEAIPQCFIHDSSDWDVKLPHLIKFIKAVNKCAVDDLAKQFSIPMKIDFEIGVNLNFTMHIENPEFAENGVRFEFVCPEVFYPRLIERLSLAYAVESSIAKEEEETESWANIFVTKRPYSMYINRPIKIFSGDIVLTPKFA
jgi:hypothetical protein